VLLIKEFGWRADYEITAFFGAVVGILTLVVLDDPERGRYDKPLLAENQTNELVAPEIE
jgi:hypothetical protein